MTTAPPSTDPAAIVDALDPEAIRAQLADLDRRADALRVLLRAALARRRPRYAAPRREEATCAAH